MKKLLLIVTVVVALIVLFTGVIVLADKHYVSFKKTQPKPAPTITVAASDQKLAATKAADATKYKSVVAAYNAQVTECQKGKVAYDKLATLTKIRPPAPVCGAPLAQQ